MNSFMLTERFPARKYLYTSEYATLRSPEESRRPWNMTEEIAAHLPQGGVWVDIGCGGGQKTIPLDGKGGIIVGIDHSAKILPKALETLQKADAKHTVLVQGDANHLPLPDNFADVVSNIMSPHNANEVIRVLKPGGYFIIERVGEQDKWNVKTLFGTDRDGQPRGYRRAEPYRAILCAHEKDLYNAGFCAITLLDGYWDTFYTPDGFRDLLRHTPTINNYDEEKDKLLVDAVIKKLKTKKGIQTEQHRIFLITRKPYSFPPADEDYRNLPTLSAYDADLTIPIGCRLLNALHTEPGIRVVQSRTVYHNHMTS